MEWGAALGSFESNTLHTDGPFPLFIISFGISMKTDEHWPAAYGFIFVVNKNQWAQNFSRWVLLFSVADNEAGRWQSAFCLPGLDWRPQVVESEQVIVIIVTALLWPAFTVD